MDPTQIPIKDIHLPAAIPWWPPAPGWWLLAALILVALYQAWRLYQRSRHSPRRQRERMLRAIRTSWKQLKRTHLQPTSGLTERGVSELSEFLRRVALALNGREQVAGLSGEAWLRFLDESIDGSDFRQGPGRLLIDAPYRRAAAIPALQQTALIELCDRWVEKVLQHEAAH